MNRFVKYASVATRRILSRQGYNTKTRTSTITLISYSPKTNTTIPLFSLSHFSRPFCSSNNTSNGNGEDKVSSNLSEDATNLPKENASPNSSEDVDRLPTSPDELKVLASELVQDVETKEILEELQKYFGGEEDSLEKIAEMVLTRAASGKHEESDQEIMYNLRRGPVQDVHDSEFESDFEELHDVDKGIKNLYKATEYTEKKLLPDESKEMTAEEWDKIMEEFHEFEKQENAKEKEKTYEQQTVEEYIEAMASQHLPEKIRKEIEAKFNKLCEKCERDEVEPEAARALFKEFEEKMVEQYAKKQSVKKGDFKKGPGEGPILRWETRVVLSPGGDAWHPKNRRVKVSVYVKELRLSKYAAKRLRALVGKRYNIGKDELTIVGRRFEHREENRKDVLRIIYALIEEAKKADVYVNEAYTAIIKERLETNPEFQERLRAHIAMSIASQGPSVV